jgi:predicted DNA-binding transcriptional regulator YafY
MYLLDRGRATAPELARHFETSERTIYRDIDALSLAGVPLTAQSGPGGGYFLAERFTLNRGYLTPDEVLGLMGALGGIAAATPSGPINQAVDKIKALTPLPAGQALPPPVAVALFPWGGPPAASRRMEDIRAAIDSRRLVSFSYLDGAGRASERVVEPYTLALGGLVWYVHGYCRLRKAWRLFRLSRVSGLKILDERYDPRAHLPAPSMWGDSPGDSWGDEDCARVRLRFTPGSRLTVMDSFGLDTAIEEPDGSFLVEFYWPENDPPIRFILGFGPQAAVLEPLWLRASVAQAAQKLGEMNGLSQ